MILGIDPGLTGALVVYDPQTGVVEARNIPTLEIQRNGKAKRAVNIHSLIQITRGFKQKYPTLSAVVELVGAMPGQGVSAMFSFGRTDGIIEAAVVAAEIPYSKVPPQVWKKALGCIADKDATLQRANQLIPQSAGEWTPEKGVRNKEDCKGIAEAALLAFYAAKNLS